MDMDAPEAAGGDGSAPSPVEVVLAGLAACSGIDVVTILTKMKVPPQSLEVRAEAERAEKHPRTFTSICLHYVVAGDVPPAKLERAIALSAKTYCSVGIMLGMSASLQHDYQILDPA
jgi:putative redox protein